MPGTRVRQPLPAAGEWVIQDLRELQWSHALRVVASPTRCPCSCPYDSARTAGLVLFHALIAEWRWSAETSWQEMPLDAGRMWVRWRHVEALRGDSDDLAEASIPEAADALIVWALNEPGNGLAVVRQQTRTSVA